jgi:hypothetical protein
LFQTTFEGSNCNSFSMFFLNKCGLTRRQENRSMQTISKFITSDKRYRNSLLQTQYFKCLCTGSHLLSQCPLLAELCKTIMELGCKSFNTWCQHFSHLDYRRKHYAKSRAPEKLIFTFQIRFINEDLVTMHCSSFIIIGVTFKNKST